MVRQDLPTGVLAAQLIHAAGESAPDGSVPTGTFAVALGARSLDELQTIERKLLEHGIPHRAVREPDAPWNGELMAIGIEPLEDRSRLKKITSSLPLLR